VGYPKKKGRFGPNFFHLCLSDSKTTDHIFIKCIFTRQVWEKITLALNLQSIWDGNELLDCFDSWAQREHKLLHLPSLICWTIWLERNKTIFENGTPSIIAVAYKALRIYKSWKEAHIKKPRLQYIKKGPDFDDTPIGWFYEATLSNGSQSGDGGLIKTTQNTYYKWNFNCGPSTNTRKKLLGAWATLYLCYSKICLTITILYIRPFSISLCRLVIPF
jgi:hypothetical protein